MSFTVWATGRRRHFPWPSTFGRTCSIIRSSVMANSKLLIQVEHYLDKNPRMPEAYQRFEHRMDTLDAEVNKWASVVFDDVTWMELAARRYHQFHLNIKAQHPWQWFAGSTDLLELAMQMGGALPVITAFACHVGQEKDEAAGMILRAPNARGRL